MNTVKYLTIIVAMLLATELPVATAQHQQEAEYQIEGKSYGLPEAKLFQEEYDGPPVVGDYLTRLPEVVPLSPGNRTHEEIGRASCREGEEKEVLTEGRKRH